MAKKKKSITDSYADYIYNRNLSALEDEEEDNIYTGYARFLADGGKAPSKVKERNLAPTLDEYKSQRKTTTAEDYKASRTTTRTSSSGATHGGKGGKFTVETTPGSLTQSEFKKRTASGGTVTYNGKKYSDYNEYSRAVKKDYEDELNKVIDAESRAKSENKSNLLNKILNVDSQNIENNEYRDLAEQYRQKHNISKEEFDKRIAKQKDKNERDQKLERNIKTSHYQAQYAKLDDNDKAMLDEYNDMSGLPYVTDREYTYEGSTRQAVDRRRKAIETHFAEKGYDSDALTNFSDYRRREKNAQETQELKNATQSAVDWAVENGHPGLATVMTSPVTAAAADVMSWGTAIPDAIDNTVRRRRVEATGAQYLGADVNSPYQQFRNTGEVYKEDALKDASNTYKQVYNTAESILTSLATRYIGSSVSGALGAAGMSAGAAMTAGAAVGGSMLGIQAYNDTLMELESQGIDERRAQATAIASGINEMLWESLSIELFPVFQEMPLGDLVRSKAFKDFIKVAATNVAKGAVVNASEEFMTEVGNIVAESLILGADSDYQKARQKYEMSGDSHPSLSATREMLATRGLEAAKGGAIQGLVMGAASNAYGIGQKSSYDTYRANEAGREIAAKGQASEYIEAARQAGGNIQAYLEKLSKKRGGESNLTQKDVGKIALKTSFAEDKDIETAQRVANVHQEAREKRKGTKTEEDYIDAIRDSRAHYELTNSYITVNGERTRINANNTEETSKVDNEGRFVAAKVLTGSKGNLAFNTGDGRRVKLSESAINSIENETTKALVRAAVDNNLDSNAANLLIDTYDGTESAQEHTDAFMRIYRQAELGTSLHAVFGMTGNTETDRASFTESQLNAIDQAAKANKEIKAGLTRFSTQKKGKFTEIQENLIDRIAKAFGKEVVLVDNLFSKYVDANGREMYRFYNGEALTGENRIILSSNAQKGLLLSYLGHEMGHMMKAQDSAAFNKFADIVRTQYGDTWDEQKAKFKKLGYGDELVEEELVANAFFDVFTKQDNLKEIFGTKDALALKAFNMLEKISREYDKAMQRYAGAIDSQGNLKHSDIAKLRSDKAVLDGAVEAMRNYYNSIQSGEINTPAEAGERMSISDAPSVEQIEKNYTTVSEQSPVISLTGNEFAKGEVDLVTQVSDYFDSIGNLVKTKHGDVVLDRDSVKNSIGHGIGRLKAIAFKAVPEVLKNGEVLSFVENYDNKGYDRAVFVAPIKIETSEYFEAVVVTASKQDNRFYLHEVAAIKKNGESPFKTDSKVSGETPSIYNILQRLVDVKNNVATDENGIRYSMVDDDMQERLDKEETVKTYRAMVLMDGKLYPPMATFIGGKTGKQSKLANPSELGKWYQSEENPDIVREDGKFPLNKEVFNAKTGKWEWDSPTWAAYNPYMHSSNVVLNDQFKAAYKRPNLVTVECEVPVSELNGAYKADKAKDATGWHSWNAGSVATAIKKNTGIERQVLMSRYIKPVRIMSDAEVAQEYKRLIGNTGIAVSDAVVPPGLLKELKKLGIPIEHSDVVDLDVEYQEGLKAASKSGLALTENSDPKDIYLGTKDVRYSFAYLESGEHLQALDKEYNAKEAVVSLDDLVKRYGKIADIWRELGGELNSEFLNKWNNQKGTQTSFEIFKSQTGYKYNIELSTMCKKGIPLFEAIDTIVKEEVSKQLKSKKLGMAEKEILYDILKKHDFEIPCAICYVEQARQREGDIIDAFLNGKESSGKIGWNTAIDAIAKRMKSKGVDYTFPSVSKDIATDNYAPADLTMDEKTEAAFMKAMQIELNKVITQTNEKIKRDNEKATKKAEKNGETPKLKELKPMLKNSSYEEFERVFNSGTDSNMKIFKVLLENPDSRFKLDSDPLALYSSFTTLNLSNNHHDLYSLFNQQGGVSTFKTKQRPIAYMGELLGKNAWNPSEMRGEGGIRMQSNSDFQMYTLFDLVQEHVDLTAKGFYLQGYTKVPAELKLFGLSGDKLNGSVIPSVRLMYTNGVLDEALTRENAGLDENGNLIFDGVEGINPDEIFMLVADKDYSKGVTAICIGYSDKQIFKMLDDKRIGMIIGFHDKTDDPTKRYAGARYAKNYNGLNEATKKKSGETVHIAFNQFIIQAEEMFGKNREGTVELNGREYEWKDVPKLGTALYLEYCEKKGLYPAYYNVQYDGVRASEHENYYKLLADFGLYDSEGVYAPQEKVAFNMPDTVPVLKKGKVVQVDTKEYIKNQLKGELEVRDKIAEALNDKSENGIIPEFVRRANELQDNAKSKSKYSISDEEYAPTFYSQMGKVVDNINQEKLSVNGLVNMLKGKGVKDEEIQWSGIEEWLADKGKSVTKQELQEFIQNSMLNIETVTLNGRADFKVNREGDETFTVLSPDGEIIDFYYDEEAGTFLSPDVDLDFETPEDAEMYFNDPYVQADNDIDVRYKTKWHQYKTNGGENYREILFTVPGSEYSNQAMDVHWGRPGVLAHARIQDMPDADGNNMLFIDEIQSDWHNAAEKKFLGKKTGYSQKRNRTKMDIKKDQDALLSDMIADERLSSIMNHIKSNNSPNAVRMRVNWLISGSGNMRSMSIQQLENEGLKISDAEKAVLDSYAEKDDKLLQEWREAPTSSEAPPEAPFKEGKYVDYVLKNLLRMAAENGYDKLAWTPSEMQSERWSDEFAEGYRIEYDQDIPKFLNKFGKKFGAKVGVSYINPLDEYAKKAKQNTIDMTMEYLPAIAEMYGEDSREYQNGLEGIENLKREMQGTPVWSIDITSEMRNSVLYEGQPMYSVNDEEKNIGYHAGDLGKAEYLSQQGGYRGTGHFGTGTYFVGDEEKVTKDSHYGKRPQHAVDFSDYNLYKVKNDKDGYALHDDLKVMDGGINPEWTQMGLYEVSPYRWYKPLEERGTSYKSEARDAVDRENLSPIEKSEDLYDWQKENLYWALSYAKEQGYDIPTLKEYAEAHRWDIDEAVYDYYLDLCDNDKYRSNLMQKEAEKRNSSYRNFAESVRDLQARFGYDKVDEAIQNVIDYQETVKTASYEDKKKADSLATVFMKSLGYDGVDVRGTGLDNTAYGSVIYDVNKKDVLYSIAYDVSAEELEGGEYLKNASGNQIKQIVDEVDRQLLGDAMYYGRKSEQLRGEKNAANKQVKSLDAKIETRNRQIAALRQKVKDQRLADDIYYQRRIKEIRDDRDQKLIAQKIAYRESKAQQRENVKVRDYRAKIQRTYDNLSKELLKPNAKRYVPEGLVRTVSEVLSGLSDALQTNEYYTSGAREGQAIKSHIAQNKKLSDLKVAYDALKNDERYSNVHDPVISDMIQSVSENVNGKTITEMNSGELEQVYTTLKAIEHTVRNAAKVEIAGREADAFKVADRSIDQLKEAKKKKINILTKFVYDQLNPYSFFRQLSGYTDGGWMDAHEILNNGQLQQTAIKAEITEAFRELTGDKRARELMNTDNLVDVGLKDAQGNAIPITRGMMISLYMHLQNEQNMRHIERGGLTVPDLDKYYKGDKEAFGNTVARSAGASAELSYINRQISELEDRLKKRAENGDSTMEIEAQIAELNERYNAALEKADALSENIRLNIEKQLTDYDRAWIKKAQWLFDEYSKGKLNEATMRMYGFRKANENNYMPIRTDSTDRAPSFEGVKRDVSLENAGFMKDRQKGASNAIYLEDIVDVIQRQMNNVATYSGLAPAVKDFEKIYGKSKITQEGEAITKSTVQGAVNSVFGQYGQKYIHDLVTDVQGGRKREPSIISALRGNAYQAALTLNLRVAMAQAGSYPTAAAEIGWKPLMKALAKGGEKGLPISKADRELIAKYTPLLANRINGGHNAVATGESGGKSSVDINNLKVMSSKSFQGLNARVLNKTAVATDWISKVDAATVGRLWYASQYYVDKNSPALKKGTDAYYQEVAKVFNRVVERTQPSYTTMQRSALLRNPNEAQKLFTMYMTQRAQNFNLMYDSAMELRAKTEGVKNGSVSKEELSKSRENFGRVVSSQLAAGLTLSAMKIVADAIQHSMKGYRDDDDDEVKAEKILEKLGTTWLESELSNVFLGSEIYSMISSLITKENYYGISVNVVGTLGDFTKDFTNLVNNPSEKSAIKFLKDGGTLVGIPATQIQKFVNMGKFWYQDIVDGGGIYSNYEGEEGTKQIAAKMINAYRNGDTAKYRTASDALDTKSVDSKQSAIRTYLKEKISSGEISKEEAIDLMVQFYGYKSGTTASQSPRAKATKAVEGWLEEQ